MFVCVCVHYSALQFLSLEVRYCVSVLSLYIESTGSTIVRLQDSDSSKTDLHNSVLISARRQILALQLGRCFPFGFVYFNFLTRDHMHCIYSQVTMDHFPLTSRIRGSLIITPWIMPGGSTRCQIYCVLWEKPNQRKHSSV